MTTQRHAHFSIELDCPPGNPRPVDLIEGVLEGSGLLIDDFDTGAPFFGMQTWILKEASEKDDLFIKAREVFKERIDALYKRGVIRYGSW